MSLRQKIEDNPTLFVLWLLLSGFIAGLATYKGVQEILGDGRNPSSELSQREMVLARRLEEEKRLNQQLAVQVQNLQREVKAQAQHITDLETRLHSDHLGADEVPSQGHGERVAAGSPAQIERPCPRNDTFQCAARMPFGVRDDDTFRDSHDMRYYLFEIAQAGRVNLRLDPMPNSLFVVLSVHDDNVDYTEVFQRRFDAGKPGSVSVALRAPGRYYAVLDPGSCCSGAPLTYGFTITH